MDFRFTSDYAASRLDEIVAYLIGPRLWIPQTDYPDFLDWAGKAYGELKRESKRAIIALAGNNIAGVVIYQRHKQEKDTLEIKNLTVRPDVRGRYIASFLLRNSEIEGGKEFGARHVLCDAKSENLAITTFLLRNRYSVINQSFLYAWGTKKDTTFRKDLMLNAVV